MFVFLLVEATWAKDCDLSIAVFEFQNKNSEGEEWQKQPVDLSIVQDYIFEKGARFELWTYYMFV